MTIKGVLLRLILSIEFFVITPMILAKITGKDFFYSLSEIFTLILSIFIILGSISLYIKGETKVQWKKIFIALPLK